MIQTTNSKKEQLTKGVRCAEISLSFAQYVFLNYLRRNLYILNKKLDFWHHLVHFLVVFNETQGAETSQVMSSIPSTDHTRYCHYIKMTRSFGVTVKSAEQIKAVIVSFS